MQNTPENKPFPTQAAFRSRTGNRRFTKPDGDGDASTASVTTCGNNDGHSYAAILHRTIAVDAQDSNLLGEYRWRLVNGYVARREGEGLIYLHRQIMLAQPGDQVDHIDRNPLNNRRENLRIVRAGVNQHNRGTWGRSKFRGVGFHKGRWRARIKKDGRSHDIGLFATEIEAAKAYDAKAIELYGSAASLNIRAGGPS